jgi:Zn-finger nucleic acid-binding protein
VKCPRTNTPLNKVNVGKVPVYVSEKCGGVFLEHQTLKLFESSQLERGKALAKHLKKFKTELIDLKQRVTCPCCPDTVMLRRFYSPLHVVEIDECPSCGGIWLDSGELSKLQSLMLNEKEKAVLRAKLLDEHQVSKVEGMEHLRDRFIKRQEKMDKFLELAYYLSAY